MIVDAALHAGPDQGPDPRSYANAVLNILEDSSVEKLRLEAAQKAAFNILADFSDERAKLADVQKAVLNVLEDSAGEKARLESTQKAILNLLEDFDVEKKKVEQTNRKMAREIAERKQAEEALRRAKAAADAANRELEAFSYSVSHDLRAPLRSMDGFSQALLEDYAGKLDAQGRDSLLRVRAASQRMAQLIDDMLQLSRVTRSEVRREEVDLGALAREIAAGLQKMQPERKVEFLIADGMFASGDGRLLRIALENLLSNAWKFTSKRESTRIEFGITQREGKQACFLRDNGAGFDMAYADKLFGVFQRLHGATEFPGTGIGLATIQRIIHKHGGRIWAEGDVDKGATFYFTLS